MDFSFQIICVNVCGMGLHTRTKYRSHPIPYKIKEIVSTSKYVPTLYALLETKLRHDHKRIKLPNGLNYLGETSGGRNLAGDYTRNGGIFLFKEKSILVHDKKKHIRVISSQHAMYCKLFIDKNISLDLVIVYLSYKVDECEQTLKEIDQFLTEQKISKFAIVGDFNIDFNSPRHVRKVKALNSFLNKYNLFDLAAQLNSQPSYTWRGKGKRIQSKSCIDHFFINFQLFNKIEFCINSFSDHKTITVGMKSHFSYSPPKWRPFLFQNSEFLDLMKKETISFLFDNADAESKSNELKYFLDNEKAADMEFEYNDLEYGQSSVLFTLLQHLKRHHDKFYSKLRLKNYEKTKSFDKHISKLYDEIDNNSNSDAVQQINYLIFQQQEYFKNLVYCREETNYIQNLILDGKSNSLTFRHIKQNKRIEYNLMIDGKLCNEAEKVANIFANLHAEIVSPSITPSCDLNAFLKHYDLSLNDIFPRINDLTSPNSTTQEFKNVIKSMKSSSTPGISSQPKALFEFLFNFLPKFSTDAFNNFYTINIDESPFKSLKLRNIAFIPKKGCDLTDPDNFRPISLLEVMYKILSKALNKKVTPLLNRILHFDQFGFVPSRQMSVASSSIVATLNAIKQQKTSSQFISFDLRRAFDKAMPSIINEIILHIFPEGNFAQSWINLTSGGKFRSIVKGKVSPFFELKLGTSQGGPSASTKFNFIHHLFIAALESKLFYPISLKINQTQIPAGSLADDTWKFFQLKHENDVNIILDLFHHMKRFIGLEINTKKTNILTFGDAPKNLNLIGETTPYLKHLGIYLSFDMKVASKLTYDNLLSRLDNKSKLHTLKYGYNIFKRRNLCMSILNSTCFHIYRIYTPDKIQTKQIWKVISKFLWSSRTADGTSYRFKISQNTIESDFIDGGLNFLKPENQSFSIWLPNFINVLKHAKLYQESTLGKLTQLYNIPVSYILDNFGSQPLYQFKDQISCLFPCNDIYLDKLQDFCSNLEKNKITWLYTPILSFSPNENRNAFSQQEMDTLHQNNLKTIASILKTQELSKTHILVFPMIKSEICTNIANNPLAEKLRSIVDDVRMFQPLPFSLHISKYRKTNKTFFQLNKYDPSILSFHFKRMHKEKIRKPHPSIQTRKRDGKYFPDEEMFSISLKKLFSMPILIYYKSFFFEQYIRTLTSKNKLFKFHIEETNLCIKCNVISDTEHAIFACIFPNFFAHVLGIFLDERFNNGRPEFIFLKENFFLFNIWYPDFSDSDYTQLSLLILVAKDRALKISKDERLASWNNMNCFSQSMFTAQFTSKLLNEISMHSDLVTSFHSFLIKNKDRIDLFTP